MKRSISEIIKEALLNEGQGKVRIDDSNLFLELVKEPPTGHRGRRDAKKRRSRPWQRTVNFVALVFVFFACVIFTIYGITFFVKDVILYDGRPVVSNAGAIIPQRSCDREQVLFFFNAADFWAPTGVQLRRGDRIRISHSGGFHSDIKDVYSASLTNDTLRYHYFTGYRDLSSSEVDKCLYRKPNTHDMTLLQRAGLAENDREARFGSILWQVNSENCLDPNRYDNSARIHQIAKRDAEQFIRIRDDGELFITVNDIYLTDAIVAHLNEDKLPVWIDAPDSLRNNPAWARAFGLEYVGKHVEGRQSIELLYEPEQIRDFLREHPEQRTCWFNDNIGNEMICIEIERTIPVMQWFSRWYRSTERLIADACNHTAWYEKAGMLAVAVIYSSILLWAIPGAIILTILLFLPYKDRNRRPGRLFARGKTQPNEEAAR